MEGSDEEDICTQDENKYINEVVKAILMLDYSKKPFKQADILKFLAKKPSRKQWSDVLDKSKMKLKELGLILREAKFSNTKVFFVISNVCPLPSVYRFADETEVADRTLLIIVLTYIFMKEGIVTNVDLFNHLEELNIYNEEKPQHEYFGDVKKKILSEFVGQLYLEKIIDKESEIFKIQWGDRATAEISKRSILEFVCEIGYEGLIKPENLASHYETVLEEEKSGSCGINENDVMIVDN